MPNDKTKKTTWKPIATAPKDGRQILCGVFCFYDEWESAVCRYVDGKFVYYDEDDSKTEFGSPTHWTEIPDPPKEKKHGKKQSTNDELERF